METARIRELRARVNDFADGCLHPDDLRPRLWIDGSLTFKSISAQVASELTALAPFGAGNPCPLFRTSRVEIIDGPRRVKDRHLKMAFKQDGRVMRGIAWRALERETFVASIATRSISRSPSSRTPGTASAIFSFPSPISAPEA
jgi:single-stranded-DNA-specific exonuclease